MPADKQIEAFKSVMYNSENDSLPANEVLRLALEACEQAAWTDYDVNDKSTHPNEGQEVIVLANDGVSMFHDLVYYNSGGFLMDGKRYMPIVNKWKPV